MKILFIGCGSVGRRHIQNIRSIYKMEHTIMAYRTLAKSRHLTESFFEENKVEQFSSLQKALDKKPDVTFITNPTGLHIPMAIKAAESGSHLFIEKPLSNNLKGINKLKKIIKEKRLITFIGFNLRFYPILQAIKKELLKNKIGKIISIRAQVGQYLPSWHPNEDYSISYSASKKLGGGVILDLIHEIDYTRWLLGEEIQEVFCYGGKYSKLNIETEDNAEILMKSKNSVVSLHLDYLQYPLTRDCTIIGTKGRIGIDLSGKKASIHDLGGRSTELTLENYFDRNISFMEEIRYFFDCVKKKRKSIIDINEGYKILKIALAAKKSIECGLPVMIK